MYSEWGRYVINIFIHTSPAPCTFFIEMVEMFEILDGRVGKRSVERVRYVIKQFITLGHCEDMESFYYTHVFPLAFGS